MSLEIKFIDLFCGIGGFRTAADNAFRKYGYSPEFVFSSDIDKYAQQSYFANYQDIPYGDITEFSKKPSTVPAHDVLLAGFPCQPFSIIGNGYGFDDTRGTLFFDIAKIIDAKQPEAFVLENVKRLVSHREGKTFARILKVLNGLGYQVQWKILNALDYGLPQKRERVFIVGFRKPTPFVFPQKQKKYKSLNQILEKKVDAKYYASERIAHKRKMAHTPEVTPSIWHENKSGNISSHPYSCALRSGASHNYLLVNGERRLTPREMLRLQGFPDTFKIVVPEAQVKKQAGNAVPVNLAQAVLEQVAASLSGKHSEITSDSLFQYA